MGKMMVTGFWDETLFPMVKDMVRYGADLIDPKSGDDLGTMAVDAAALALGSIAPEFLPFAEAAAEGLKPLARTGT